MANATVVPIQPTQKTSHISGFETKGSVSPIKSQLDGRDAGLRPCSLISLDSDPGIHGAADADHLEEHENRARTW